MSIRSDFHEFLGALSDLYLRLSRERDKLQQERDRLLVIATKHCDSNHHDWDEILRIAND